MPDESKSKRSGRGDLSIIGDAILAETIRKEMKDFKLNENYILSPNAIKTLVFTNKVTSTVILENVDESLVDPKIKKYFDGSVVKGNIPITSSSVYGWDTKPLVRVTDSRFYHPKTVTEITKRYGTSVTTKDKKEKAAAA